MFSHAPDTFRRVSASERKGMSCINKLLMSSGHGQGEKVEAR